MDERTSHAARPLAEAPESPAAAVSSVGTRTRLCSQRWPRERHGRFPTLTRSAERTLLFPSRVCGSAGPWDLVPSCVLGPDLLHCLSSSGPVALWPSLGERQEHKTAIVKHVSDFCSRPVPLAGAGPTQAHSPWVGKARTTWTCSPAPGQREQRPALQSCTTVASHGAWPVLGTGRAGSFWLPCQALQQVKPVSSCLPLTVCYPTSIEPRCVPGPG